MAFQKNITTTTRAALQTKLAANAADINTIYRITDAVGSTKVIDVIASTVSALYGNAENLTDSTFGVYDIGADTFVAQGGGSGVASVSGNIVDNTDPVNPVVTSPYTKDADNNVFYDGVTATLGTGCTYNTFEQAATSNVLGNDCTSNAFAQAATNNTLGTTCIANVFQHGSQSNELGASCSSNTFGQGARDFIFGDTLINTTIAPGVVGADYTATPDYDFLYGNAYPSQIFFNGADNYHSYVDPATKRIVLTNLGTLAVSYIGGDGYVTISSGDWTTLVGASGLSPGTFYRVTSAYTFDFYGAKDIIVVADSVNTIQTVGLIPFAGDILVRYTVDSALTNPGTFMDCYPIMALDPDAVLGYVGGYNWKFNAGMPIYLKMTGDYYFSAQVDGQDTSSIIYTNCKALQSNAGVWDLGLFGTYTPETAPAAADDYFTPNPILKQIRLELSSAEIQAGVAVDIPGTSAPSGYFADATDVRTQYTYGTTPYTNEIFIKTSTAIDPQWGSTTVLLATSDQFKSLIDLRSDPAARIVYVDQRQLQVVFSASSAFGDGTIVLFITVQFIKIAA